MNGPGHERGAARLRTGACCALFTRPVPRTHRSTRSSSPMVDQRLTYCRPSQRRSISMPILVLLCSLHAGRSRRSQARHAGVAMTAIDVGQLTPFRCARVRHGQAAVALDLHRAVDTSFKRNLGLLLARWRAGSESSSSTTTSCLADPADLTTAAGLLDEYAVVGLANGGMPDNSVVCHALRPHRQGAGHLHRRRRAGGRQAAFTLVLPQHLQRGLVLPARRGENAAVGGHRAAIQHATTRSATPGAPAAKNWATPSPKGRSACWTPARPVRRRRGVLGGVPARPAADYQRHYHAGAGFRDRVRQKARMVAASGRRSDVVN